jgi:hypothetical protein
MRRNRRNRRKRNNGYIRLGDIKFRRDRIWCIRQINLRLPWYVK